MTEGERRALTVARSQSYQLTEYLRNMLFGHDEDRAAALVSLRAIAAALGHTVEPIKKEEPPADFTVSFKRTVAAFDNLPQGKQADYHRAKQKGERD